MGAQEPCAGPRFLTIADRRFLSRIFPLGGGALCRSQRDRRARSFLAVYSLDCYLSFQATTILKMQRSATYNHIPTLALSGTLMSENASTAAGLALAIAVQNSEVPIPRCDTFVYLLFG